MAYASGQGGSVFNGATEMPVAEWEMTKTSRLAEATNSASSGWAQWHHVLTEVSGRFNIPWDDTIIPEDDLLFDAGNSATLELLVGDSGLSYTVPAICESLQIISNAVNDIVRAVCGYRGNGVVTGPA